MPKFLEDKLKRKYGAKSKIPYKIMNAKGFMRGNKETAMGRAAEKKHEMKHEMMVHAPIRGLSSNEGRRKKKKKNQENYDPFARAMNK